jgi:hypothetical protein
MKLTMTVTRLDLLTRPDTRRRLEEQTRRARAAQNSVPADQARPRMPSREDET